MEALKHYGEFIKNASLKNLQELFGIKNENEIDKFKHDLKQAPTQEAIMLYRVSYEYLNFKILDKKVKLIF